MAFMGSLGSGLAESLSDYLGPAVARNQMLIEQRMQEMSGDRSAARAFGYQQQLEAPRLDLERQQMTQAGKRDELTDKLRWAELAQTGNRDELTNRLHQEDMARKDLEDQRDALIASFRAFLTSPATKNLPGAEYHRLYQDFGDRAKKLGVSLPFGDAYERKVLGQPPVFGPNLDQPAQVAMGESLDRLGQVLGPGGQAGLAVLPGAPSDLAALLPKLVPAPTLAQTTRPVPLTSLPGAVTGVPVVGPILKGAASHGMLGQPSPAPPAPPPWSVAEVSPVTRAAEQASTVETSPARPDRKELVNPIADVGLTKEDRKTLLDLLNKSRLAGKGYRTALFDFKLITGKDPGADDVAGVLDDTPTPEFQRKQADSEARQSLYDARRALYKAELRFVEPLARAKLGLLRYTLEKELPSRVELNNARAAWAELQPEFKRQAMQNESDNLKARLDYLKFEEEATTYRLNNPTTGAAANDPLTKREKAVVLRTRAAQIEGRLNAEGVMVLPGVKKGHIEVPVPGYESAVTAHNSAVDLADSLDAGAAKPGAGAAPRPRFTPPRGMSVTEPAGRGSGPNFGLPADLVKGARVLRGRGMSPKQILARMRSNPKLLPYLRPVGQWLEANP